MFNKHLEKGLEKDSIVFQKVSTCNRCALRISRSPSGSDLTIPDICKVKISKIR